MIDYYPEVGRQLVVLEGGKKSERFRGLQGC